MKIYSNYELDKHPDAEVQVEWIPREETCNDHVYAIRMRQNERENNWLRNLNVVDIETRKLLVDYKIYHITYERKHEYYAVEIDESIEALKRFLATFPEWHCLVLFENEFWLDTIEE